MDLVVDANIIFAVLIRSGKTEELLFKDEIHLFAPEFLLEELEKYKDIILEKTGRDEFEFPRLLEILKKRIKTIPNGEIDQYIEKAKMLCPDENDADYFALALKLKCAVWSNDKKLKEQDTVKIYSTEELIKEFELE